MGIKRYTASFDTTITNAYKQSLTTRGTGSNMGASDILETFSIYGQVSGSSGGSQELSRILLKFPVNHISASRYNGDLPVSGNVSFYLNMSNVVHGRTLPSTYTLMVMPVSNSWSEGAGLDMEGYTDEGYASWLSASTSKKWDTAGGDYHSATYADLSSNTLPSSSFYFENGNEDLELDITNLVEEWIVGEAYSSAYPGKRNYGIGIHLTGTQEAYWAGASDHEVIQNTVGTLTSSYYTKMFYGRGTEYFFKRPAIEARWDSATKDNRANCYLSSAMAPAVDNLNTLYLYNYVRGELKNIPNIDNHDPIYIQIHSGTSGPSSHALHLPKGGGVYDISPQYITGGYAATGTYSASFATTSSVASSTYLYDVWLSGAAAQLHDITSPTFYHTGAAITPKTFEASNKSPDQTYYTSIKNLRDTYVSNETARFRVYTRAKDWNPTLHTVASTDIETTMVESASFKVYRLIDDMDIVPYGTGSDMHTQLSYDMSGSYFDLDMSMLQPDYAYGIKLVYRVNGKWVEQPQSFKFRVE